MENFTIIKTFTDKVFNRSPTTKEQIELKEMKLEDHKCFHHKEVISLPLDDFLNDEKRRLIKEFPYNF
jgi:hypothetical protein